MNTITKPSFCTLIGLRSLKLLSAVAGLGLVAALSAPAAVGIVNYSFAGTPTGGLAPTTVAANASAGNIAFGSGLLQSAFADTLVVSPVAGATTSALAQSLDTYFQFTVAPAAGYALNLTSLSFQASYGWSGASYTVRSSADGFASVIDTEGISTLYPALTAYSMSLAGAAYQSLTAPLTFRIYDFNPVHGTGIGSDIAFNNLSLGGTVITATPEPTTLALLGVGGMALLGLRRRRA